MDYNKIGQFITTERKAKNLTQAKLAEKLYVSEKTVSKWENGKGLPDTNTLPILCEIFEISINELLNGERIAIENYENKAESKLLELERLKEISDKRLLSLEILIGALGAIMLLTLVMIASLAQIPDWLRIVLIVLSFINFLPICFVCLRIEQVAGYYECKKCKHKYIPTYKQINMAMHMGRTRYLKCPKCGKKSWNRKVVK